MMNDYITIKRQFVLDAIDIGLSGYITDDDKLTLEGMGMAVTDWPSVEPKRNGHWLEEDIHSNWSEWTLYSCSECGKQFKDLVERNFCPHCGAEMEGES